MLLDVNTTLSDNFSSAGNVPSEKSIVIFTSGSFVAHQHLNHILPFLAEQQIKPVIFLTSSCKAPRANLSSLQQYAFYEGDIFNEVIYPTVEAENLDMDGLTLTFNQMVNKYNTSYQKVEHHTDPAVRRAMEDPGVIGSLSIYQDEIFKSDFINYAQSKGFFWNLHPAVLPENRGLYIAFWSLLNGKTDHGYTLHEIDNGIDTGRIISTFESQLDPGKPIVQSYIEFAKGGSDILKTAIAEYMHTGRVNYKDVKPADNTYYTFPTEEDVSYGWDSNVRLWGTPEEMLAFYQSFFGNNANLEKNLREAITQVENGQRAFPPPEHIVKKKNVPARALV